MAYQKILTGNDAKQNLYVATLTQTGWTDNAQTLSITGLATSGYAYTVSPEPSSLKEWCESGVYADNVLVANQMTFHCDEVPTSNLTVEILRIQVI